LFLEDSEAWRIAESTGCLFGVAMECASHFEL
jgi:hypothetical protein